MRAAVLREHGSALDLCSVPDPVPEDGEVLVRVRATGICGTDVKITSGLIPGLPLPLIPGHEVAGELLEDAGDLEAGQSVACYIFQPCDRCRWCRGGQQTLCPKSGRIGFERDGGLAELIRMRPQDLVPFEGVGFDVAAVTMDAVLTPWRALRVRGGVLAGDSVLVVGAGGLGLHAVQIARAAGADVVVVDPDEGHAAQALALGASAAFRPGDPDLRERSAVGFDVVLESSGAAAGFEAAIDAVRVGGTVVCCGYRPGLGFTAESSKLALSEINVVGSRGGSVADARAAMAAVERGEISPLIAGHGELGDASGFVDRLAAGGVTGRLVVVQ